MRKRLLVRQATAPKLLLRRQGTPSPVVKWAGGKTKLLPLLAGHIPESYNRYFEPFLGGGALFFHLNPERAVLSDMNADLIGMYKQVANSTEKLIRRLRHYRKNHDSDFFYATRERWNARPNKMEPVDRAAAFIYLNKTCYNGLWRVNSKGLYNVPVGRYKNPQIFDETTLRAAARVLKRAQLSVGSFERIEKKAKSGDLIYFDPPYHPLTETANFTSYTKDNFGAAKQRALAELATRLADKGCHVILSNSDTPFTRELYKDFEIRTVQCARAINSSAKRRGPVPEVIATR